MTSSTSTRIVAAAVLACAVFAARADAQHATGAIPISKERYERFRLWQPPAGRPQSRPTVDLPPVGDQGNQMSCAAWAVAYGCGSFHEGVRRGRRPTDADHQFSPAFIYNRIKVRGGGSYIVEAYRTWQQLGLATLADMPYTDKDDDRRPTREALANARHDGKE